MGHQGEREKGLSLQFHQEDGHASVQLKYTGRWDSKEENFGAEWFSFPGATVCPAKQRQKASLCTHM